MSTDAEVPEDFFPISGHGLSVQVPVGWEARIWATKDESSPESNLAVVHLGSFPLPSENMHFGGLAPGMMRPGDFFAALVEYGKPSTDSWFKARGFPLPITWLHFRESLVRNSIPQHVGMQHFCSLGERTFCLYLEAVAPPSTEGLSLLNATLGTVEVVTE